MPLTFDQAMQMARGSLLPVSDESSSGAARYGELKENRRQFDMNTQRLRENEQQRIREWQYQQAVEAEKEFERRRELHRKASDEAFTEWYASQDSGDEAREAQARRALEALGFTYEEEGAQPEAPVAPATEPVEGPKSAWDKGPGAQPIAPPPAAPPPVEENPGAQADARRAQVQAEVARLEALKVETPETEWDAIQKDIDALGAQMDELETYGRSPVGMDGFQKAMEAGDKAAAEAEIAKAQAAAKAAKGEDRKALTDTVDFMKDTLKQLGAGQPGVSASITAPIVAGKEREAVQVTSQGNPRDRLTKIWKKPDGTEAARLNRAEIVQRRQAQFDQVVQEGMARVKDPNLQAALGDAAAIIRGFGDPPDVAESTWTKTLMALANMSSQERRARMMMTVQGARIAATAGRGETNDYANGVTAGEDSFKRNMFPLVEQYTLAARLLEGSKSKNPLDQREAILTYIDTAQGGNARISDKDFENFNLQYASLIQKVQTEWRRVAGTEAENAFSLSSEEVEAFQAYARFKMEWLEPRMRSMYAGAQRVQRGNRSSPSWRDGFANGYRSGVSGFEWLDSENGWAGAPTAAPAPAAAEEDDGGDDFWD